MGKSLILTCEHATNHVPAAYRSLFRGQSSVLGSHRGWDPGTLELGQRLQQRFRAPLVSGKVSRLLIEMNRSRSHPQLFSEYSAILDDDHKQALIQQYYLPYRAEVERLIAQAVERGEVALHLSLHSFTAILQGVPRTADVGLLYDPRRSLEREFCRAWKVQLNAKLPSLNIRQNYPYLGKADGLTTSLRKKFPGVHYLGIELEVNQNHAQSRSAAWLDICTAVETTLEALLSTRPFN